MDTSNQKDNIEEAKEYDKKIRNSDLFKLFIAQKEVVAQIKKQEREQIKNDLLKVAEEGELEDLRREITNYFHDK